MAKTYAEQVEEVAAQAEEAGQDRERRTMDPELRTLGQMLRLMEDLSRSAKSRVITYLVDRCVEREQDPEVGDEVKF